MSNVTTIITKKGLHANRLSTTPFEGELIYTTDTKQIYIGDSITPGGNQLSSGTGTGSGAYFAGVGLTLASDIFSVVFGDQPNSVCAGDDPRLLPLDERDALAGTQGTPSDTNRFVTNEDLRLTDARTPNVHDINILHNGVLLNAKGGTGFNSYSAGQLLIGNNSGQLSKNTITGAGGITITNGDGIITIDGSGASGTSYQAGTGLTLTGDSFSVNYGITNTTACVGNDPRLEDARTPTNHDINSNHTGTLAINRGGTGQSSYTNGQLLIGNASGNLSKNTITGAGGITITNGDGIITIDGSGASGTSYQAGTGLTLTGDSFSVNYGITNTTACVGNDPRLEDARTPTNHDINSFHTGTLAINRGGTGQSTFTNGQLLIGNASGALSKNTITGAGGITITNGDGIITIDGSGASGTSYQAGTGLTLTGDSFSVNYGITNTTACVGNDPRLENDRTPTVHIHAAADTTSGQFAIARIPTGTTDTTVAIGNDSRFHAHAETGILSNGFGERFVSTLDPDPAVGVNGDMWLQYD